MPHLDSGPIDFELDWFRGIHPETGEDMDVLDSGQDRTYKIEYVCSKGCGWSARQLWFDLINNADEQKDKIIALDIETKAQGETPKETGAIRVGWDPSAGLILQSNRVEGSLPRSYTWGELRSTSRTSGNTD
jgi:hypothetical protein